MGSNGASSDVLLTVLQWAALLVLRKGQDLLLAFSTPVLTVLPCLKVGMGTKG